ncbi:hypothetical protein DM01DRAFT_1325643 [Hesseltinella vesiculosa]|uniref:Integrator complex subunit 2 n=1 Tax=Hesseltinella vesiculosa TaxID=101127 RepID=A0A1X2GAX4_9FUNG|nr:hypothetical protein DM01DRAFT_1325643 [Hesseltinella vesiculosa]
MATTSNTIDILYELLNNGVFRSIDYKTKIFDCLTKSTLPLHSQLIPMLKEYVKNCLLDRTDHIPESWIIPLVRMKEGSSWQVSQVLLTLYMLQYNASIIAMRMDPNFKLIVLDGPPITQHSSYLALDIGQVIPLRAMLTFIEHHPAYQLIYPEFVSLIAAAYPEILDVTSFLLREGRDPVPSSNYTLKSASINKLLLSLASHDSNPEETVFALKQLERMDLFQASTHAQTVIDSLLVPCLEPSMDKRVVNAFVSAWETFHQWIPNQVWLATINCLLPKNQHVIFHDLIKTPIILFQCDPRIFNSTQLLPLWLLILQCIRTSYRHRIWQKYHIDYPKSNISFNNRNVMALINGQDSEILQLLLEKCKALPGDSEDMLSNRRKLFCRFMHGVFVDDREGLLIKALHFQTYAIDLIPMMVKLVPSMFTMCNHLPELIRQPYIEKQVFGTLLGCYLCEKYPMDSTLVLAERVVLPRVLKIAMSPTNAESNSLQPPNECVPSEYLNQTLPGLAHLAHAFPHISQQIIDLLRDIQACLPPPNSFFEKQGSSRIIILLQLHKILQDALNDVSAELRNAANVNKACEPID